MLKVLCIEDDDDDFDLLKTMLVSRAVESEMMFFVERARSVDVARTLDTVENYDLYVVDYHLDPPTRGEARTGLDFVRQIYRGPYRPSVILISGYDDFSLQPQEVEWVASGSLTFLAKRDLTDTSLLDAMRGVLHMHVRVLLADAHEQDFHKVRAGLATSPLYHFSVDWAGSRVQFFGLLEQSGYDVLVIDSDLDGDSGVDLARELSGRGNEIPVLLITGAGELEMDEQLVRMLGRRQLGFLTRRDLGTESLLHAVLRAHETRAHRNR